VWGLDLSGSVQGAGGVGGLLWETSSGSPSGTYFASYDGNGNVVALTDVGTGATAAQYEYGPFGEVIRKSGPASGVNPFRFSTKYQDEETDLVYYGYRYYNAGTGRWMSRDHVGERGGCNLYGFVCNSAPGRTDPFGLFPNGVPTPWPKPGGGPPLPLGGAWEMLFHLFLGDLAANVTLSDELLDIARLDIMPTLINNIGGYISPEMKCCQSGYAPLRHHFGTWTIPENHLLPQASMGNWQVDLAGQCFWKCGSLAPQQGCCPCVAQCNMEVFIHKTYTFLPTGFNTENSTWPVRFYFYGPSVVFQWLFQDNTYAAYFIWRSFRESCSISWCHEVR
jgi:RHS repeat-associated protein